MRLGDLGGAPLFHDVEGSFGEMLRLALDDRPVIAALGPLYPEDPARELLAPFARASAAVGWSSAEAPGWALEEAQRLRCAAVPAAPVDVRELVEWTRAGLVLELGARWGVRVVGAGTLHPHPRLRGGITGRFGYEGAPLPGGKRWNPLTIPRTERHLVVPAGPDRMIAAIDFRAMDLCAMLGIVPGLRERYGDVADHVRTAELILPNEPISPAVRDVVKRQFFVHAYGGESELRGLFEERIPELGHLRRMEPGEAGRLVQTSSARAFRAALSRALPLLTDPDCRPMFAVHDEITLDALCGAEDRAMGILKAMEAGASEGGVVHTARWRWGKTYLEAKGD